MKYWAFPYLRVVFSWGLTWLLSFNTHSSLLQISPTFHYIFLYPVVECWHSSFSCALYQALGKYVSLFFFHTILLIWTFSLVAFILLGLQQRWGRRRVNHYCVSSCYITSSTTTVTPGTLLFSQHITRSNTSLSSPYKVPSGSTKLLFSLTYSSLSLRRISSFTRLSLHRKPLSCLSLSLTRPNVRCILPCPDYINPVTRMSSCFPLLLFIIIFIIIIGNIIILFTVLLCLLLSLLLTSSCSFFISLFVFFFSVLAFFSFYIF